MSQLTARAPGMVGTALAEDDLYCGLIADGHHVSRAAVDIAWRCKGSERLMLVTDAMPSAGTGLAEFMLQGKRIRVKDGVCQDENGTLAGASLDLASAMRNMMAMTSCSLGEAAAMASATPANFLGLSHERGSITVGKRADLVVTDPALKVLETYIAGRKA
jgi:N-acetylglucosamine-6-phosphate deacetylase